MPLACKEAGRRGLPVRVVHSTRYGAIDPDDLHAALDEAGAAHPDVTMRRVVEDADPVHLLIGAVSVAELVVVGRRRPSLPLRSHLGPVARAVVADSAFPVLLAPAGPR